MQKTSMNQNEMMLTTDLAGLKNMLGCGRQTAEDVAENANAVIRIGRRKLYHVARVREYLDKVVDLHD